MSNSHWRDQIGPERDEGAKSVSDYPQTDDGRQTQTAQEAYREVGAALGNIAREVTRILEAMVDGYAGAFKEDPEDAVDRAVRAFEEWQRYLAGLPWWKRWAVKLWYSL